MNLVDENIGGAKSNKKIFIACGVGIVILLFIVVALIAYATSLNKGITLVIDGKNKTKKNYLTQIDDAYYIQVKGLVESTNNGYTFNTGNPDIPDFDGCYITNTVESTYFKVGSEQIYKIQKMDEGTQEITYYNMEKPAIRVESDNQIYIPISSVKIAANTNCIQTEKRISIESIGYIQNMYNQPTQNKKYPTFTANDSIVWEVSYSNMKMLRDRLVITKESDSSNRLGVAVVDINTTGKGKKAAQSVVLKNEIVSPRYLSIQYVEKYDLIIVETDDGKGILKLVRDEGNNVTGVKNIITPQYKEIKPINDNLYLIAETVISESIDKASQEEKETIKYGIINAEQEKVVPTEYDQIGIDSAYQITNNNLDNEFIISNKYIPVKKAGLWGLIDLEGNEVIKPIYDGLGCTDTNPSSNIIIIPEIDAFIFKRNRVYGIASFKGEIIIKNVLNRIYIDTSKEEKTYSMIYKDKTYNVIKYIEDMNYMNSNDPTNTTNATNTVNNTTNNSKSTNSTNNTNTANTTKTTNTTNKTNTANATNTENTTNTPKTTSNNTVVIISPNR